KLFSSGNDGPECTGHRFDMTDAVAGLKRISDRIHLRTEFADDFYVCQHRLRSTKTIRHRRRDLKTWFKLAERHFVFVIESQCQFSQRTILRNFLAEAYGQNVFAGNDSAQT